MHFGRLRSPVRLERKSLPHSIQHGYIPNQIRLQVRYPTLLILRLIYVLNPDLLYDLFLQNSREHRLRIVDRVIAATH